MGKNIVLCIDGTNNQPERGRTNVSRFFRMAAKVPGRQVALYQPGVGTLDPESAAGALRQKLRRGWDLATAWMMKRHVLAAYRYLMDQYETGDRIFLLGFSRGAYTCRVLAGMLHKVGLLHRGHHEMLPFAWRLYIKPTNFQEAGRFKKFYGQPVQIEFLGLWDTVRSVGLPWRPKVYPNTFDNDSVRVVRHALALDERRVTYPLNLWTSQPAAAQDVRQVFFPGVHSDIGGGYLGDHHAGLGAIPLAWIVEEARLAGVEFLDAEVRRLLWRKDKAGPKVLTVAAVAEEFAADELHDELVRRLGWRLLEWLPIPRFVVAGAGWKRTWAPHRGRPRPLPEHCFVHQAVRLRQAADSGYQPRSLPAGLSDDRFVG